MADKKISDFTAATAIADDDLVEIETAAGNSRKVTGANLRALNGAKVRKSVALTAQNLVGGHFPTFNTEDWDTAGYHDTVTNSNRLTPPVAGYYQCTAQLVLSNVATGNAVILQARRHNSSDVFQEIIAKEIVEISVTGEIAINITGTALFASGDFAAMAITVETDNSVDISTETYWEIRRVG